MPSWGKRKPEEAPQGQGRRAVRQAVAEGGNDRDVIRRLVDVLATLSLVNAAELRELTATVFKTYLVPGSASVAEAMASRLLTQMRAREVERLAHRVEQYSLRMAELLRRGAFDGVCFLNDEVRTAGATSSGTKPGDDE